MKKNSHSDQNLSRSFKNRGFLILVGMLLATIIFAYANHFSNSFHFDDSHTIQTNSAIRQINIKRFFTDASTFSSLPANQSYRPLTTLENAIDYRLGGGLDTRAFHFHIFLTFLITCLLIGVFVKKLLNSFKYSEDHRFWALLCAAVFALLCANAETVNYIIQRAEITAALFVLAGLVAFLSGGFWRKYHVYLVFPLIGFFAKEMAFVFAPLLLLYLLIFEEQVDLLNFYRKAEFKKVLRSFYKALPAFIMTVVFYVFYTTMLPTTFTPGGVSRFNYLITQPMVMVHYIVTYFVPYNLSADTDWAVYNSIFDYRALIGIVIVGFLVYTALKASQKKDTRLYSFGILWFFITLLPTSSFIPFAEVLNDHRSFIPYIGLTIAFVFGVNYILHKFLYPIYPKQLKNLVFLGIFIFLAANVYGVRQRNEVWHSDLSLWKDVTIKSPKNGRGFMNYGLALMAKGDFKDAEANFNRALELNPNYDLVYVNLGIVKNALGDKSAADSYFHKALEINKNNHASLYFYAKFLNENNRVDRAKELLEDALRISPRYGSAQKLLMSVYHKSNDWDNLKKLSLDILDGNPNNANAQKYLDIALKRKTVNMVMQEEISNAATPQKYLNLSLHLIQNKNYIQAIEAGNQALKLKSNYPEAYNNIGIAYYLLGDYNKAIEAYKNAIALRPDYNLAKNNLKEVMNVLSMKTGEDGATNAELTAKDYLNLSLSYYNKGKYMECIQAAQKSNEIAPNSGAYNNICAAYNQLKEYDKAIAAGEKALELNPNNNLANGNLKYAISKSKQ